MKIYKNITYVNSPRFYGIAVRMMWKKEMRRKYFSFSRYGRKAWSVALECRNEFEKELGKPRTERKINCKIYEQGITKRWLPCTRDKKKRTQHYIISACKTPGKLWRTSVSIAKHGDKALKMAKEIRRVSLENYFE